MHNNNPNLKKDRRGGFYWKDGEPYASVTTILSVIDKPQLRYWFGREVFRAMVVDPTLSEQEALAAPYSKLDKAASRGTTIHSLIEAYKETGAIIKDIPEEFRGYGKAFYSWVNDFKPEILEVEKTVFSKFHKYAGTLDLLARIGTRPNIIDFKTNKDGNLYDEVELQLSAYYKALQEETKNAFGSDNDRDFVLMAVGLSEGGNYQIRTISPNVESFLAAKRLWIWKNKDLCKEVGYKEVIKNGV